MLRNLLISTSFEAFPTPFSRMVCEVYLCHCNLLILNANKTQKTQLRRISSTKLAQNVEMWEVVGPIQPTHRSPAVSTKRETGPAQSNVSNSGQ